MANDGLEIFFASLAHALRDDGIAKANLVADRTDRTALGDEDISRLARIASGRWKALVSQQERQEHDLASEMLAADPVAAETAAERIGADNGIPAEFLLKARQLARGKLRRPDDPDGTTCPAGHSFSMPESMGQVLPRRPFGRNAKDHLRGFELVALVDSAPLHDAWLAKGPDSRTVILRFFEGGNGLPGLIRKARPAWDAAMDRMELSTIGPMTADKGHPRMIRPLDAAGLGDDMVALDATGIYPLENICRGRKPILDIPRQEDEAERFMSSIQSLARWLPNRPIAMGNIMAGNDGKPVLDPWTLAADRGGPGLDANAISLRWLVGGEPRRNDEAIVEDCLENHIVLPRIMRDYYETALPAGELRTKISLHNLMAKAAINISSFARTFEGSATEFRRKASRELQVNGINENQNKEVLIVILKKYCPNIVNPITNQDMTDVFNLCMRNIAKAIEDPNLITYDISKQINSSTESYLKENWTFLKEKDELFIYCRDHILGTCPALRDISTLKKAVQDHIRVEIDNNNSIIPDIARFIRDAVFRFFLINYPGSERWLTNPIAGRMRLIVDRDSPMHQERFDSLWREFKEEYFSSPCPPRFDMAPNRDESLKEHVVKVFRKNRILLCTQYISAIVSRFKNLIVNHNAGILGGAGKEGVAAEFMKISKEKDCLIDVGDVATNIVLNIFQDNKLFLLEEDLLNFKEFCLSKAKSHNWGILADQRNRLVDQFMEEFRNSIDNMPDKNKVLDVSDIATALVRKVFKANNLFHLHRDELDFKAICLKEIKQETARIITPELIELAKDYFREQLFLISGSSADSNASKGESYTLNVVKGFMEARCIPKYPEIINRLYDACFPMVHDHIRESFRHIREHHLDANLSRLREFIDAPDAINNPNHQEILSRINDYFVKKKVACSPSILPLVANHCLPEMHCLHLNIPSFAGVISGGLDFCWVPPGKAIIGGTSINQLRSNISRRDHVQNTGFWISRHVLTYRSVRAIINACHENEMFLNRTNLNLFLLHRPLETRRPDLPHVCSGDHCNRYWDFFERPGDCQAFLDFPAVCMQKNASDAILAMINSRFKENPAIHAIKKSYIYPNGHKISPHQLRFRLPTSGEWEYALRGGPFATNPNLDFHFGSGHNPSLTDRRIYNFNNGNFNDIEYLESSGCRVLTVNRQGPIPNLLGIMGMQGNAWELTSTQHSDGSPVVRGGDNRCPMHEAAACFEKSMKSAGFVSDFTDNSVCHGVALRLVAEET